MTERGALVTATAASACLLSIICLGAFSASYTTELRWGYLLEMFLVAVLPATASAGMSMFLLTASRFFRSRHPATQSIATVFLAYVVFSSLLVVGMSGFAYVKQDFLDVRVGPIDWRREAILSVMSALFAFAVSVGPAFLIEYFVIRFVRKRFSPAPARGVSP